MTAPLVIMGATSGIGRSALDEAVRREVPVRAFARSANDLPRLPGVEPVPGDALSREDVARAIEGAGGVIYALGIRERLAMLWEEETLFSESTALLLDLMRDTGLRRLIVVTGFGAGRSRAAMSRLERIGHGAILGKPYADKDRQEELLRGSDTDWTIVRPVILTNGAGEPAYRVLREPAAWRNGLVSRRSVAHYLVEAYLNGLDIRGDVVLAR